VSAPERRLRWRLEPDPFVSDEAIVRLGDDRLSAEGTMTAGGPEPFELRYELETGPAFVTTSLRVRIIGPGREADIELRRSPAGDWSAGRSDGEVVSSDGLEGALDVDLGYAPLFNSLPVLRHGLHLGPGQVDLVMAWVSVPDLELQPLTQRYSWHRRLSDGGSVVRYESPGFSADLEIDAEGFVLRYPGLGER
jgi:hypothetical protein